MKLTWRKTATGNWLSSDNRWLIRKFNGSRACLYWIYWHIPSTGCGGRYTPTGKYEDCVSFLSVPKAKAFCETAPHPANRRR